MPPTIEDSIHLARVARAIESADILISGGSVINIYSGEILPVSVAVARGRIAYVRSAALPVGSAEEVVRADGYLLCPGYIEAHSHPWVIYNPLTLENAVLPLGTTTHIADNLPFYQHGGVKAFKELLRLMESSSSRYYWTVRAVPQSMLPDEEAMFSLENIETLLEDPRVVGIAEITRWKKMLNDVPPFAQKIAAARNRGKKVDGHTAGCDIEGLNVVAALGVASCHESINGKEAVERMRLGMWTMLRNSSIRPDLESILAYLLKSGVSLDRLIMTTDAPEPTFVAKNGFSNGLLKVALEVGVDPLQAIRMVTLNPAVFYGLDQDVGAIAPGRFADILFLESIQQSSPAFVMTGGEVAGKNGRKIGESIEVDWTGSGFLGQFVIPQVLHNPTALTPCRGKVPVIELVSSGITRLDFTQWDGMMLPPGLQYCCLLGRRGEYLHTCFLRGFAKGVKGLATSFTTSMGVLLIGDSLAAMQQAARRIYDMQGGIVLWEGESSLLEIPLEIAGMMSTMSFETVVAQLQGLFEIIHQRGFIHNDLLLSLLFLSCDFLPEVRITPLGVLDVKKNDIIY